MSKRGTTGSKPPLRVSIMLKSLLVVLVCALAPLVLSWVLTVPKGMQALEETAELNLQTIAQVTATQLDQLFDDTSRLESCLAGEECMIAFCCDQQAGRAETSLSRLDRRLNDVLSANSRLALLYLADSGGVCRASTSPDMVGVDYRATRLYMREALDGRHYISDLAMGITTKEPGVFFSGPIRDDRQRIVGALVMKLRGSEIDAICRQVTARLDGGFAAVVDSRGVIISNRDARILYHSVGDISPGTFDGVDPRLQYGVQKVESLGMNELAAELRKDSSQGRLAWADSAGNPQVAGFAAMSTRPWRVIVAQPRSAFDRPMADLRHRQIAVLLGAMVASSLLAIVFVRRLVRPIRSLSLAARSLSQGDWSARAHADSNDELGDLARTFNDMIPRLQQHTKMADALRLAMEIQRRLLPQKAPEICGADVAGVNIPADQTGGDYYDFLDLSSWEEDTLAVAVGDVTGHGIAAALLMTTARALLRSRATPPGNLSELITDVNSRLADDTPDGRFMTLMYMIVQCRTRSVRLVSAGHDPVICYDPAADTFRDLGGLDLPLAVKKDEAFTEVVYADIPAGSILLAGTDGIWETADSSEQQYGKDRLQGVLRRCKDAPAQQIVDEILADLARFRGDIPQQDDVTAVVIKLRAPHA